MPDAPSRTISGLLFVASFLLGTALLSSSIRASESTPAPEPKTFVYVLRLIPRLHDDKAWTEKDVAIVQRHASHLTAETKARRVILAGRTTEPTLTLAGDWNTPTLLSTME